MARLARGQGVCQFMEERIADLGLVIQPNELTGKADRPLVPFADSNRSLGCRKRSANPQAHAVPAIGGRGLRRLAGPC